MKVFGWQWGTFFLLAVFTINTVQSNLHDKGGEILTVDKEEVWNTYYPTQWGNSSEVNKSGKYIYWKTYFLLHLFHILCKYYFMIGGKILPFFQRVFSSPLMLPFTLAWE